MSPPGPEIELCIVTVDSPQPQMSPPAPGMIVNELPIIIVEPRNEPQSSISTWDLEEGEHRGWGQSTTGSTSTSSLGWRSTRPRWESIRSAPTGEDGAIAKVKAGGKIIGTYRSLKLGKILFKLCITGTSGVALIYYHTQSQSQTTVVILILILITCGCLGTISHFLGLVLTDAFPRSANVLDLLGVIFFFGTFFGGISLNLPPEVVWFPLGCWLAMSAVVAYLFLTC